MVELFGNSMILLGRASRLCLVGPEQYLALGYFFPTTEARNFLLLISASGILKLSMLADGNGHFPVPV